MATPPGANAEVAPPAAPAAFIGIKMISRKGTRTAKERTYEETLRVTMGDITPTAKAVLDMLDTSYGYKIGAVYIGDANAKCIDISCENNGRDDYWDATYAYSTAFKLNGTTSDPLAQAPTYDWDEELYNVEVFLDTSGDPIVNSAFDAYEKYPEVELPIITCEMIRNENSGNFTTHFGDWFNAFGAPSSDYWYFRPMCNSASFTLNGWTIPARWAKLTMKFEVKPYSGGGNYYEVHYRFAIKRGGWRVKIPQYGFYELDGSDKVEILDMNGKPTKKPWPLDASGAAMPNPDDMPDSIEYVIYPEMSFASFSFT